MIFDYRNSHLKSEHANQYNSSFSINGYRKIIWNIERKILIEILKTYFKNTIIFHFDFACGTGRIASFLEVFSTESIAVDVSESMLEIARNNNRSKTDFINIDITKSDFTWPIKFNLITAFRFFPNAQASLREEVLSRLYDLLSDDGYLVFNNHKCIDSAGNRIARLFNRRKKYGGMSKDDCIKLLEENFFIIDKVYYSSILPFSESRYYLALSFIAAIENLIRKIPIVQNYGENIIYVCRKINKNSV